MLDQAKLAEESISSDFGKSYAVCNEKLIDEYMNSNILISEIDKALKNSEGDHRLRWGGAYVLQRMWK